MDKYFRDTILKVTQAQEIIDAGVIQSLWSGYGNIIRYKVIKGNVDSVVVKHVRWPKGERHPRGWNTNISHQRKLKSYEVETAWYTHWSNSCDDTCRVPHCLAVESLGEEVLMVLEDLDASGFSERRSRVTWDEIDACLIWLAHFHATFMGQQPTHLWACGTYWHLATRPDELKVLMDFSLKNAAQAIDKKLNSTPYLTFVHGDAKLANFCFTPGNTKVAAVDFQYVGGGCGMKDVAYFIGSCLFEADCEKYEEQLLHTYFTALRKALLLKQSNIDLDALEENWRMLYPYAWTDFHRFLKGWSPGHWKINSYSERLSREVVSSLNSHTN